ncbi:Reduced growth phenotype protein 1 [Cinnamomum micranthum f. kanehirae]|uniref:Reduced growth phenotype protein 1 n=1 Tax=Cinnamomum micranthum f. kanehirae TaxID=337451 RepID=A0A443N315_9MAGN|nr:Reduced growth phenotype protein 1 [Cinnamomum micranthum f. kanehirae]
MQIPLFIFSLCSVSQTRLEKSGFGFQRSEIFPSPYSSMIQTPKNHPLTICFEMQAKGYQRFSFLGRGSLSIDDKKPDVKEEALPSLKLQLDKDVYRPGDSVIAAIEIQNPNSGNGSSEMELAISDDYSILVEYITFELKGIEKLDTQWFTTQKPPPGSKQRRGEHVFLDCTASSIVSKVMVSSGCTKTYIVRAELPNFIPPSFRGSTVRYLYYVRSTLCGRCMELENGHSHRESKRDLIQLEARAPLQIWVTQKTSGLLNEEGILPATTIQMDIYWKEKDADSEWARASEIPDGLEEGYESSRDEISSVSSYNPARGNIDLTFQNSLSLQSPARRSSSQDFSNIQGEYSSSPSYMMLPQLSMAEALQDPTRDAAPPKVPFYSSSLLSPSQQRKYLDSNFNNDETGVPSTPRTTDPVASEGFIRGRSYNIRMDDQVLLRFSPKNSDSNYYFSDMIGGTLTFFHEDGARRCLEVSITLETSENISQRYLHPSRRNSATITKGGEADPSWWRRWREPHPSVTAGPDTEKFAPGKVSLPFLYEFKGDSVSSFFSSPHGYCGRVSSKCCCSGPHGHCSCVSFKCGCSGPHRCVQSDHHEVVSDLVQTSFLFSIPADGPMSFSTPHVSVRWALRFEFFTTPKNVDWTRYEHPLLIEGRDKCEWILPITVHAPPPRTQAAHARNEKPVTLGAMWTRT